MQQNLVGTIDALRQTISAMLPQNFHPEADPDIWLEHNFNHAKALVFRLVNATPPFCSVATSPELRELQLIRADERTPSFVAEFIGTALRNIDARSAILRCQN